jgi:5'-methylthioadenosine phosphorylase
MSNTIIGIIGGTGLYAIEGITEVDTIELITPYGAPSSPITTGKLGNVKLLFIARHGIGHVLSPSEINYRANIYALKQLGAIWCISVSAVGSLMEEVSPGDLVVPDQFIDRTKHRQSSFFGEGIVAHVPFADPFCPVAREKLFKVAEVSARRHQVKCHNGGTYLCMEGPVFSTRAESNLYRSWGAKVIGMTNLPEAKLAREAELAFATLCLVTDYDCWRTNDSDIDIGELLNTLKKNSALAKEIIIGLGRELNSSKPSSMATTALANAVLTSPEMISSETREKVKLLIEKYGF